jgi:hypothetical protein
MNGLEGTKMTTSLNHLLSRFAAAVAAPLFALASASALAAPLPTCIPNVTCLVFGDFNVYSLPLLNLQAGHGDTPGPGDPYYYKSTYGEIKNFTIIGINNGQSTTTGNPPAFIDGSENTPSPNNTTNQTFTTFSSADPAGGPAIGDRTASWDASVSTMQQLIGNTPGAPLVIFFAFNETGTGTGLLTTDLLVWLRATLYDYDAQGNVLDSQSFYLTGDGTQVVPDVSNLPPTTGPYGPWVYVHAGICVSGTTFTGFPDSSGQCAVGTVRNQNSLGQNAAAFAVTSPSLDAALYGGTWDVLSFEWQMAYINGGGETAWIQPNAVQRVPEPATIALLGFALLGMATVVRRRSRR